MKPVIYCIEEFEYFNPYGARSISLDQIYFLILFSCREGTVQLDYKLSDLVKACKEHEPKLYYYLENLLADMEEFYHSENRLMQGLEKDGFDVSRLLYVFFDNYDLEYLFDWIRQHGKNQVRRTVQQIQANWASMDDDEEEDFLMDFGEFLHLKKKLNRTVYEAMKKVALGYLPTFNLLKTDLMRSFNTCINDYAMMMVDSAMSKWGRMEQDGYDGYDDDDDDEDNRFYTLEGQRQFWINYRKNSPVKGIEDNPIFCIEIVEFVEEWETKGWNKVRIWYKLTCAEGEWYEDIYLENLLVEALLYFPDIYDDAIRYYQASSSPMPRDPAILRGLQRKGHDLTPVLTSYVTTQVSFLRHLREDLRLQRLNGIIENAYERETAWEAEDRDPENVAEFQIVNLLRSDLVSEGMAVILREVPEFHINVPKPFLLYMERNHFDVFVDPLNDLHKELKSAFEMKRGYKQGE